MTTHPHGDLTRFQNDRFGMFIRWSVYALWGINEWCLKNERISDADYQFNDDHFDPRAWAKAAGMHYVAFTTIEIFLKD